MFEKMNILPVGISVDAPANVKVTIDALKVPFPMLSDQDLKVHNAFHVLNILDQETIDKYSEWNLQVEKWSNREHHSVAVPSMFLIDEQSVVRWAHGDHDYKKRPQLESMLRAMKAALAKKN